jgi:hypothetical protein
VRSCVIDHEAELLEDFLVILYESLGSHSVCEDDGTEEYYEEYAEACSEAGGSRLQLRLDLIREALLHRLKNVVDGELRVFLVIDGLDNCSASLRLLLDSELRGMQSLGVHVMITLRAAVYDNWEEKRCDHPNHIDVDNGTSAALQFYYTCEECRDVLCFPCEEAGRICQDWYAAIVKCLKRDQGTDKLQ